jgi:hypothetical protein
MKTYCYHEPTPEGDSFIIKNEQQILDEYWDYWKEKMEKKYGKDHRLITKENCIEDWSIIHWAEIYAMD